MHGGDLQGFFTGLALDDDSQTLLDTPVSLEMDCTTLLDTPVSLEMDCTTLLDTSAVIMARGTSAASKHGDIDGKVSVAAVCFSGSVASWHPQAALRQLTAQGKQVLCRQYPQAARAASFEVFEQVQHGSGPFGPMCIGQGLQGKQV
jgi:hypothetical protein